jgi:membrane protein implicated in regulation of membrane protease activity
MIIGSVVHLLSVWKSWLWKSWFRQVSQPRLEDWPKKSSDSEVTVEGKIARVLEPGKKWQVQYASTLWSAQTPALAHLKPGDWVKVIGRQGIILLIEPIDND